MIIFYTFFRILVTLYKLLDFYVLYIVHVSNCDFTGAATFTSTSNNLAEPNVKASAAVSSALLEETFGKAINVCQ